MSNEAVPAEAVQTAPMASNFAHWEDRLARLEADVIALPDIKAFPQWWYDEDYTPYRDLVFQLQTGEGDASDVGRYYQLWDKQSGLTTEITGYESNSSLDQTISNLGEEVVAQAFTNEPMDGILHQAMLEELTVLADSQRGAVMNGQLALLQRVYGTKTITELLGVRGDDYADNIRDLMHRPNSIRWMRFNENKYDSDAEWSESLLSAQDWMARAITASSGMLQSEAMNYAFSASRKNDPDNESTLQILRAFDHFGTERIRNITRFTGIHGLEAYTIEQLERMEALANNPAEVSEKLAGHDVTVVLVNRFGDHNGVMEGTAANFDDGDRTLFFEINSLADIYRRMASLRKTGIKPATLVLSAHSGPGQFIVSDLRERNLKRADIASIAGKKLVEMVNAGQGDFDPLKPGETGFAMHDMAGMARLVETYMQPSRGIDDPDTDTGRKKVIFQACDAGTETQQADVNNNGEKVQIGVESVISQLGKDLVSSGIKSDVDIYGAPAEIQMHRTEQGVRYSGQPLSLEEGSSGRIVRSKLHARRIRIKEGALDQSDVAEIALRK